MWRRRKKFTAFFFSFTERFFAVLCARDGDRVDGWLAGWLHGCLADGVVHLDTDRKQKILTFNAFNWRLMDLLLFISLNCSRTICTHTDGVDVDMVVGGTEEDNLATTTTTVADHSPRIRPF